MELQEPDLSETVHKIVAKGVTQITIVPILLLTAGHAKHDIPKMIEEERNKYPQIVFRYGRPIEIEPKMITIVEDHIKKTTDETEKFDILFVGRGSSDPQAVNDTETLVEMLREKFPNNLIEKCFLAASSPKFEKVLTEKINKQKKVCSSCSVSTFYWIINKRNQAVSREINPSRRTGITDDRIFKST